jgi:hypothetical protein
MKKFMKRAAAVTVMLSLIGGTLALANTGVKVLVNGKEMSSDAAIVQDGKTYLGLREMAAELNAIVNWDNEKNEVQVYKPNVDTALLRSDNQAFFGSVEQGFDRKFQVFVQIDTLRVEPVGIKMTIVKPDGTEHLLQEDREIAPDSTESFWYKSKDVQMAFDEAGAYSVHIYLSTTLDPEQWNLVSQKGIFAKGK